MVYAELLKFLVGCAILHFLNWFVRLKIVGTGADTLSVQLKEAFLHCSVFSEFLTCVRLRCGWGGGGGHKVLRSHLQLMACGKRRVWYFVLSCLFLTEM